MKTMKGPWSADGRNLHRSWGLALLAAMAVGAPSAGLAQKATIQQTLHNLSVSGPGPVKALTETEVCKFCHIPHNAVVPQPLWGHALSTVQTYDVPKIRSTGKGRVEAPQPDGSSRLCLSCHDGTVALGDIGSGPGRRSIAMVGTQRLTPAQKGYLGSDLTGSHPISFAMSDTDTGVTDSARDMGTRNVALVKLDPDVHLDAKGKVQCTSCHDPHSDRNFKEGVTPHFLVKPTVGEVCLVCHEVR